MSTLSIFPEGYFYILSRKHGFALDVYDGQTKVIVFSRGAFLISPRKMITDTTILSSFLLL
jgi:hypothetical protein